MAGAWQDVRRAVRTAWRHPGFSLVVVATMALGIGLNSAAFSLIDAVLLRPAPVRSAEGLVHVYSSVPGGFLSHEPMAFPDYEALRERSGSFSGLTAFAWFPLALERAGDAELVMAELVTDEYFETLGVGPAMGRMFRESDDRGDSSSAIAVLSDDARRRWYSAHPAVVGNVVRLNGRPFTIVGVAPPRFRGLIPGVAPDLWIPLHAGVALPTGITIALGDATPGVERIRDRATRWVWVAGRLRPGVSMDQARGEVANVCAQLAHEFPRTNNQRRFAAVAATSVRISPSLDRALWGGSVVAMGALGLGLLLASLNVATLFLARALGRRREIATRLALGASRAQLVRQLFFEGLLLAIAGAALGMALAHGSNASLARIALPLQWPLDLALAPALSVRVIGYALGLAVSTAVLFGLVPALEVTRSNLVDMLRHAGGGAAARSSRTLRAAIVGAQVAAALALLDGGAIALRGLAHEARQDPGFDPTSAVVATLSPDLLGYSGERISETYARVEETIARLPGVRSVAFASHVPLTAAINFGRVSANGDDAATPVDVASVGATYFETMGIPLLSGRPFAKSDALDAPRVAIVNEALARRLWPEGSAVGRRLSNGAVVVGVARDGKYRTLDEAPRPFLYNSLEQDSRGTRTVVVRLDRDPRAALPSIREAIRSVDPRVPVLAPRPLTDAVADALIVPRLASFVFGFLGLLGLLLTVLGVVGVVSYLAKARTSEIGLRLALGASPGTLVGWLLRLGLAPVAAGLFFGVVILAAGTRAIQHIVPGPWPMDVLSLVAAMALLSLAAACAAWVPARRAAGLDPAVLLREEP